MLTAIIGFTTLARLPMRWRGVGVAAGREGGGGGGATVRVADLEHVPKAIAADKCMAALLHVATLEGNRGRVRQEHRRLAAVGEQAVVGVDAGGVLVLRMAMRTSNPGTRNPTTAHPSTNFIGPFSHHHSRAALEPEYTLREPANRVHSSGTDDGLRARTPKSSNTLIAAPPLSGVHSMRAC